MMWYLSPCIRPNSTIENTGCNTYHSDVTRHLGYCCAGRLYYVRVLSASPLPQLEGSHHHLRSRIGIGMTCLDMLQKGVTVLTVL